MLGLSLCFLQTIPLKAQTRADLLLAARLGSWDLKEGADLLCVLTIMMMIMFMGLVLHFQE